MLSIIIVIAIGQDAPGHKLLEWTGKSVCHREHWSKGDIPTTRTINTEKENPIWTLLERENYIIIIDHCFSNQLFTNQHKTLTM